MLVTLTELSSLPLFVRFDNVELWYRLGPQQIEEKLKLFQIYLLTLKTALNNSNVITVYTEISQKNSSVFSNHLALLEYFPILLSICGSSRCYRFEIVFYSDKDAIPNVIAAIMQIPKINRCSGLKIIIPNYWKEQNHLLLKAVSNWVEKTAEGMENNQKRFLRIRFGYIYRVRQMFEHIKKVVFYSKDNF